ncbi:MAG TPA: hypothetical protein VFD60_09250 [Nitrososphaeraceae archaeon]|nr:hypothetical protein [Nitrososphaeraceae archaeon]
MGNFWTPHSDRPDIGYTSRYILWCSWYFLSFTDSTAARYDRFALRVLNGLLLEISLDRLHCIGIITPYNSRHGIATGMIVGMALWIILFVPLAVFGIQLDWSHIQNQHQTIYL